MIKCILCCNRKSTDNVHQCIKCKTKTVIGKLQEPFIENCCFFTKNNKLEKQRQIFFKKFFENNREKQK